jgi:hypothetical protein
MMNSYIFLGIDLAVVASKNFGTLDYARAKQNKNKNKNKDTCFFSADLRVQKLSTIVYTIFFLIHMGKSSGILNLVQIPEIKFRFIYLVQDLEFLRRSYL